MPTERRLSVTPALSRHKRQVEGVARRAKDLDVLSRSHLRADDGRYPTRRKLRAIVERIERAVSWPTGEIILFRINCQNPRRRSSYQMTGGTLGRKNRFYLLAPSRPATDPVARGKTRPGRLLKPDLQDTRRPVSTGRRFVCRQASASALVLLLGSKVRLRLPQRRKGISTPGRFDDPIVSAS